MKYAYKLIKENEEESGGGEENGLKGLKVKNELFLTAEGDLTADDLIKIINDPKNLEGVYTIESGGLKDLKLKVFGDRPNINATLKINAELYKNNGKSFYTEIETTTGEKFDKKGAVIKKDKTGNTIFVFPQLNKYNEELVEKYFTLTSDKQAKKSNLNYTQVDDSTIKFPVSDETALKKILKKAGLTNKDYTLEKKEMNENLRETIKKLIHKSYGK